MRLAFAVGGLAGATLVIGTCIAGIAASPGATLKQVQSLQIDATLGAPERLGTGDDELYTWTYGPQRAPTIVLVHGFGDAGAGWTQVATVLGKTHRVRVVDLPGHGRSGPRAAAVQFDTLMHGLQRALDEEQEPVVLVGNSLGGWLAAHHALQHPEQIRSLILVNNAGMRHDIDKAALLPSTRQAMREKNRAVMGEHAPDMPGFVLDGLIHMHQDPRLSALFDHLMRDVPKLDDALGALAMPTTVVWGTPDPFFPFDGYGDRVARAAGAGAPVQLEGCGHAPQYSCPEALAGAILEVADR